MRTPAHVGQRLGDTKMNTTTTTPHVRLTTRDLKEQYLTGKLTVKGYIYNWLLATRKRGWRYRTRIKDFCQELGISRSAFYKAIAELKAEPGSNFHFEIPHGEIEMWVEEVSAIEDTASAVEDKVSAVEDTMSTIVDTASAIEDTASAVEDTASTVIKSKTPKPAQDKASTAPTDLSHISSYLSSDLLQIGGDKDCLNKNKESRDGSCETEPAEGGIDVAKILEETKKRLLKEIQRQREQRRGRNFRGAAALGALEPDATPSSHGGHDQHHGQWDRENIPDLASTVATGNATGGVNGLHRGAMAGNPGAMVTTADTTPSSHGGHDGRYGQWEPDDSPHLTSTVATGSAMSGRGPTVGQGQWNQGEGPTSRGYGGHGERYGWRVRGGGLQPLAGVLQQMAYGQNSGEQVAGVPIPGGCYHRNKPPFSRGIP